MASFNYFLKNKNEVNPTPIYLLAIWSGNRLKLSTGLKIAPSLWDHENKYPIVSKRNTELDLTRINLAEFVSKIKKGFIRLESMLDRAPSIIEFQEFLCKEKIITPKANSIAKKAELSFCMFVEGEITKINNELKASGKPLNKNTLASTYNQTLFVIKEMMPNKKIKFHDINYSFYTSFLEFCTTKKNYKPNNIGKHIKNIKALMNKAKKLNLHNVEDYMHFNKPSEETAAVYLNQDELRKLMDLKFPKEYEYLKATRDLFLVGCWTGLRYSDWNQFRETNLKKSAVSVTTQKTGANLTIPLIGMAKEIVKRYNYDIPKPKCNVVMNRDLKMIGKLAGLDEKITYIETVGGKKVQRTVPKYELITTHTARRSFASNLVNMNIPIYDVMQITGHKTEKSFRKYVRISPNESAKRILDIFESNWQ